MQQSAVSEAVVAGQLAANCKNVNRGSTQEMAALEMDHSGSPGAALNVGPTQGMVASVDCLSICMAALNIGPTRLGAWSDGRPAGWPVGRSVSRLVGWSASWSDGWSDGSRSLKAAPNADAQPATPTPMDDAGARVTVPPVNAVIGGGSVGRPGG
jgi:hypothetical protein